MWYSEDDEYLFRNLWRTSVQLARLAMKRILLISERSLDSIVDFINRDPVWPAGGLISGHISKQLDLKAMVPSSQFFLVQFFVIRLEFDSNSAGILFSGQILEFVLNLRRSRMRLFLFLSKRMKRLFSKLHVATDFVGDFLPYKMLGIGLFCSSIIGIETLAIEKSYRSSHAALANRMAEIDRSNSVLQQKELDFVHAKVDFLHAKVDKLAGAKGSVGSFSLWSIFGFGGLDFSFVKNGNLFTACDNPLYSFYLIGE